MWFRRLVAVAAVLPLAIGGSPGPARAEESQNSFDWKDRAQITFSDRIRGEFVDWFGYSGSCPDCKSKYNFMGNQLRVGGVLQLPYVDVSLDLQDVRIVNLPGEVGPEVSYLVSPPGGHYREVRTEAPLGPGSLYLQHTGKRDQGETTLKGASLSLTGVPGVPGLKGQLGRFEFRDGLDTVPKDPDLAWLKANRIAARLVGPQEYTHVARSFDGARLNYDRGRINVTGYATRPTTGAFEVSGSRELDVSVAGISLNFTEPRTLPGADFRIFYLYYHDDRERAVKADNQGGLGAGYERNTRALRIHTWGANALGVLELPVGRLDGLVWFAIQNGDWGSLNHNGWSYALEGGYRLPGLPISPWLRVGFNHSSGDDDPGDRTHKTFYPLLPSVQQYSRSLTHNSMNTMDVFSQLSLAPHERFDLRLDYHWLRLSEAADAWYTGGGASNNDVFGFVAVPNVQRRRSLGHLVDISATLALTQNLSVNGYFGRFFGSGVVRQTFEGTSNANYGFIELVARR